MKDRSADSGAPDLVESWFLPDRFEQLVAVLRELVAAPNWTTLTICEVNPDHDPDGSSMRRLSEALADVLCGAPGLSDEGRGRP